MIKEKTKIKGIIKSFQLQNSLALEDIDVFDKETGKMIKDTRVKPEIAARLREFIRTKNIKILNALKREGIVLRYTNQHNLITTRGRAVLAGLLAGDDTYTGEINYGALGTGTNPVANSDTKLQTETYRNTVSSQTFDDNIAYIDFFYTAAEVSGTFEEFGNFIDGGAGADSGRIFSHILTGGWVKTLSTSLFVSCQYTIT